MEIINGTSEKQKKYQPKAGTNEQKSNFPEKKFVVNGISATIWKNEGINKQGEKVFYKSVSFGKNYKDKEGEWHETNKLRIQDLPKASLVINKAYEYLTMDAL
jgi:hypothetical protein